MKKIKYIYGEASSSTFVEDLASHENKRQIKSKLKHKINKWRLVGFTMKNIEVSGLWGHLQM